MKIPQKKYIVLGVILLGLLSILFTFLFGQGMFLERGPESAPLPLSRPELKIDFSVLESQPLLELEPFEKIEHFEGETGRANPFLPY